MEIFMEFIKTSEFSEMTYGELAVVDGGFVITIGALTICHCWWGNSNRGSSRFGVLFGL